MTKACLNYLACKELTFAYSLFRDSLLFFIFLFFVDISLSTFFSSKKSPSAVHLVSRSGLLKSTAAYQMIGVEASRPSVSSGSAPVRARTLHCRHTQREYGNRRFRLQTHKIAAQTCPFSSPWRAPFYASHHAVFFSCFVFVLNRPTYSPYE